MRIMRPDRQIGHAIRKAPVSGCILGVSEARGTFQWRLSQQTLAQVPNHDTRCRRVHPPVSAAYPAAGLSAHPLLRPDGEPPPETVSGVVPSSAHLAAKSTAAQTAPRKAGLCGAL